MPLASRFSEILRIDYLNPRTCSLTKLRIILSLEIVKMYWHIIKTESISVAFCFLWYKVYIINSSFKHNFWSLSNKYFQFCTLFLLLSTVIFSIIAYVVFHQKHKTAFPSQLANLLSPDAFWYYSNVLKKWLMTKRSGDKQEDIIEENLRTLWFMYTLWSTI